MCYSWLSDILLLHVISDALIAAACFSIPFTLLYFVRRREDLQFNWMFVCFAIFIVACGTTHLMEIWTVWHPTYWMSGTIKAITALASVPTAILLIRLVPDALRLPSPVSLQIANGRLSVEVSERQRAQNEVQRIHAELEARVLERTSLLEAANARLLVEVEQRRQAEEAMRYQQQLLQAIADNSMAVIYAKDLEGRYLWINHRYEEIFGLVRADILGRTDHDLFEQTTAHAFRWMDQQVLAAGRPLTEEESAPQADGLHTYLSVKAPLRDEAGRTYAVFGISTDITERKRDEEHLRAQLKRLDLLDRTTRAIGNRQGLHSIFQAVLNSLEGQFQIELACACVYDAQPRVLTVSDVGARSQALALSLELRATAHIPVDENGLGGCMRGEFIHEPDTEASAAPFSARLARAGLRSLVIAPLIVESNVFGMIIIARRAAASFSSGDWEFLRQLAQHVALAAHQAQLYDSLQRAYEELRRTQQSVLQQERLRALGQMASGIAHDISNALSPAALYAQSLLEREPALSAQGRHHLQILLRAIEDVANTVSRMREFYRTREQDTPFVQVNLNRMLRDVMELTRARWSDMPLQLDMESNLPAVMGGESEIRDALTNLVLNAVDAMPDGGTLTLRSRKINRTPADREHVPSSARVCVEVCDTGAGMSESVKSRCLEPFYSTKGERGTGLGLAMVYGMAQRHGVELEIQSSPGAGTTMRLLFPIAVTGSDSHAGSAPMPVAKALRILLIDDDPIVLQSVEETLALDGHHVTTADGGQQGIDLCAAACERHTPFDVVITDLGMPQIDGRKVAAAVKRISPRTPVLMLTGWGHRLQAERNLPEHVDRVLSKPPSLRELRKTLVELSENVESVTPAG